MTDVDRVAHSLAEAHLYLMVTACPSCGKGPLLGDDAVVVGTAPDRQMTIPARCRACGESRRWQLHVVGDDDGTVNPTGDASRLIDVGQWLTLFRMIVEAAGRADNPFDGRRFRIEATKCLEEALRFYEEDEELPPRSAFFDEGSIRRFRDHPEQFSRRRILDLRQKLPHRSVHEE